MPCRRSRRSGPCVVLMEGVDWKDAGPGRAERSGRIPQGLDRSWPGRPGRSRPSVSEETAPRAIEPDTRSLTGHAPGRAGPDPDRDARAHTGSRDLPAGPLERLMGRLGLGTAGDPPAPRHGPRDRARPDRGLRRSRRGGRPAGGLRGALRHPTWPRPGGRSPDDPRRRAAGRARAPRHPSLVPADPSAIRPRDLADSGTDVA